MSNFTIKDPGKELKKTVTNAVIIAVLIAFLVGWAVFQANNNNDLESKIAKMVEEASAKMPIKIDDMTTMKSITADGANIKYSYIISGMPKKSVVEMKDTILAGHKKNIIRNAAIVDLVRSGANIFYEYKTEAGETILELTLNKKDVPNQSLHQSP